MSERSCFVTVQFTRVGIRMLGVLGWVTTKPKAIHPKRVAGTFSCHLVWKQAIILKKWRENISATKFALLFMAWMWIPHIFCY